MISSTLLFGWMKLRFNSNHSDRSIPSKIHGLAQYHFIDLNSRYTENPVLCSRNTFFSLSSLYNRGMCVCVFSLSSVFVLPFTLSIVWTNSRFESNRWTCSDWTDITIDIRVLSQYKKTNHFAKSIWILIFIVFRLKSEDNATKKTTPNKGKLANSEQQQRQRKKCISIAINVSIG